MKFKELCFNDKAGEIVNIKCSENFSKKIISLLNKSNPLEVIQKKDYNACPICNKKVDSKYCSNCGQRLRRSNRKRNV